MAQADYSSAVGDHKTAPHQATSDGSPNAAFVSATQSAHQFPIAELSVRDQTTSA